MDMTEQGGVDRVWDLIEKVDVCMLTTQSAGRLRRSVTIKIRPAFRAVGDREVGFRLRVYEGKADIGDWPRSRRVLRAPASPRPDAPAGARYRKARAGLENNRHGVVAEWAHGSQCMLVANQATDRRIVGWTLERGDNDLRTRQGLVD